jgi:hypothetical protein
MKIGKIIIGLLVILGSIYVNSCIDEYWPDITKYDKILVIDGLLSDNASSSYLKISVSASVKNPDFLPYPECAVSIISNDGITTDRFIETNAGVYKSTNGSYLKSQGVSYKVRIETPDEKIYESDFQKMPEPIDIDTVFTETVFIDDGDPARVEQGLQFYITPTQPFRDSSYLYWKLEESYKYEADFTIDYLYAGHFTKFDNPDTLKTCYLTEKVNRVFAFSADAVHSGEIQKIPLNFVNTDNRKLSIRYSLLVKQFSIDKKTFEYYNDIIKLQNDDDLLFSSQPYQIRGNVYNINNPEEPVLGYFLVAAETNRRVFINSPEDLEFFYSVCVPDTDPMIFAYISSRFWPLWVFETRNGLMGYGQDKCFDCTRRGGSLTPPEFWIDKND